jgi:hypothetical protein
MPDILIVAIITTPLSIFTIGLYFHSLSQPGEAWNLAALFTQSPEIVKYLL